MKALCWNGIHKVQVENVPDPQILNPRDAIVKITTTAICGSDLHLYDGYIPAMKKGDILGHEFMGEVVDVGRGVENLKKGDRVVVPFTIACGRCYFCQKNLWSLCDNSNPDAWIAEGMYGFTGSGLFGYSHIYGGYAGGQAETLAYHSPMLARSRFPLALPTSRYYSSQTFFLQATWQRRTVTFSQEIRSPYGAADL